MTAPNGPILFNSSTGSDSQASGLGPAIAIYGSNASLNGSIVDVSADISFININPGDLIYCDTSTGRKFSVVMMVDATTLEIYTDDSWPTESGVAWAVGGKRATFDSVGSRNLFAYSAGFIFETETNQSITSAISCPNTNGNHEFRGTAGSIRTITQTSDARNFEGGNNNASVITLRNLKLENSNASKTLAWGFAARRKVYCYDCVFGDATNTLVYGHVRLGDYPNGIFINCIFEYCTSTFGAFYVSTSYGYVIKNCIFRNNVGAGMWTRQFNMTVLNSLFYNNGGDGWETDVGAARTFVVKGNVFYNNARDGLGTRNSQGGSNISIYEENIFAENGRYGYYKNSPEAIFTTNAFYANATAETFGNTPIVDSITLAADPFVDAANGDFNLNNVAGGGAVLRSTNYTIGG